ncbi:unnamed protein product [Rhizophagus irregularis]|nr:unnamed protein product [Rhizophagus irregularis]
MIKTHLIGKSYLVFSKPLNIAWFFDHVTDLIFLIGIGHMIAVCLNLVLVLSVSRSFSPSDSAIRVQLFLFYIF